MSETLKTAEPSKEAIEAAADGMLISLTANEYITVAEDCLERAYAVDVEPLIAEREALKKERDEWKEQAHITRGMAQHVEMLLGRGDTALRNIGMSLGSSDEWTDQATMIADVEGRVARLSRENAAMREVLGRIVNNKSADWFSAPHVSGDLGLRFAHCSEDGGPSFRANDLAVARATLAELPPEQQSTALNAGPENVVAGDGDARSFRCCRGRRPCFSQMACRRQRLR